MQFQKMFDDAMALNKENILSFLKFNPSSRLLDLGCDDGSWTMMLAKKLGTEQIYGVDIVEKPLKNLGYKDIKLKISNLNNKLPFKSNYFDVVHANQVIEHISDLDLFVSEIYRVMKPGGYALVSTENASSWHNIFAGIMGWQIFSLTNFSTKMMGLGNPMALHKAKKIDFSSWTHKTILNYLGLKGLFDIYDFKTIKIKGAGYHPFPAFFGKFDTRHAHFITLKGYK